MAKERIQWLAILRGINIILVVMYHVQLIDMSTGENHIFCSNICYPFNPIRMPLFIFCSGGLLYLSRINKQWKVKSLYIDKVYRIVFPFLFFVTFYYFFKLALNPFIKTKVIFSLSDFFESFSIYYGHPSAHLWFLPVLFWFMLLYPFFKWLCQKNIRMNIFLLFCILLYFIDIPRLTDKNYFYIYSLNNYLIFFFFGIYFFKYKLYIYLNSILYLFLTIVLYIISYYYNIPLITPIFGILSMICLSQLIARKLPNLFISFREYIYQIFLMSFIFQPFVELILWKKLFYNENIVFLFYIMNVLSGIYMPVVITKIVEHSHLRVMKICLGIKS